MKNLIDYIYNINEAKTKNDYSLDVKDILKDNGCSLYFSNYPDYVFIYKKTPYFFNMKDNENIIFSLENAANNFFKKHDKSSINKAIKIIKNIGLNEKTFNTNMLYKVDKDRIENKNDYTKPLFYKVCSI